MDNPTRASEPWKNRLYERYVSSGQASTDTKGGSQKAFRSRSAYITSIIGRHIPRDTELTIIDLGCGPGTYVYFLKQAGYKNVVGIDGSAEQVAVARQLGIEGVHHQQLDDYLPGVKECSADVVLLIDLLEHLTREELFAALDGVFRILRPGGTCIAHVPNAEGIFGMAIRHGDLTHEQAFTRQSVEQAFRTVGFSSITCFEDRPVVHGAKSLVRRLLWELGTGPFRLLHAAENGSLSPILSQNMLISAKK
jgi:SAM-dependent methyltransferase